MRLHTNHQQLTSGIDQSDMTLAQAFCENAGTFAAGLDRMAPVCPEIALYDAAISIELSLKAFLLHRGVSGDWNRTHLRHDLRSAMHCAGLLGLKGPSEDLVIRANILSPFYRRHEIRLLALDVVQTSFVLDGVRQIAGHSERVRTEVISS